MRKKNVVNVSFSFFHLMVKSKEKKFNVCIDIGWRKGRINREKKNRTGDESKGGDNKM